MRVAIINLTSGGLSGGYRKYLDVMLPLIKASPLVSRVDVFSPSGISLPPDAADSYWYWPTREAFSGYKNLKSQVTGRSPTVVFIPTARLIKLQQPTVVMIRNMEPLIAPFEGNSFREGWRNIGRSLAARSSCRRATRVIAVSPFVRDFLTTEWTLPIDKVGIVMHGVERPLAPDSWVKPRALTAAAVASVPLLFCAGSIRPARGLEDVFGALPLLKDLGFSPVVVIAGEVTGDGEMYRQELLRRLSERDMAQSVVWTGALSSAEMAWLYGNCSAFVMTSRVEACPNTALEAMAYGALSVATTRRPMPDIFGEGASYYEAGDIDGLAQELAAVLKLADQDKAERRNRARMRAGEFSWNSTAEQTIQQLRLAADAAITMRS